MIQNSVKMYRAVAQVQPRENALAAEWVQWFWDSFLPNWIEQAHDLKSIGFFDLLDVDGQPLLPNRRTILAQARLLFTFSHLALISNNQAFHNAAQIARDAITAFRKPSGLYCLARNADGSPTGDSKDELARSYDQSFVILGLSTWGRLHPEESVQEEIETVWNVSQKLLKDPETGLMLEHDELIDPKAESAPNRSQNPHMHLFEASLQAYEMSNDPIWLERAASMRAKGLEYFFDAETGTIKEFIAPDLTSLPAQDGQYREIGHQCEWAWLLLREVELGGDPSMKQVAGHLLSFADQYGFVKDGSLAGIAFDAVSSDVSWREEQFLLWPQTEAIKTYAIRSNDEEYRNKAKNLTLLMFRKYFAGRAAFANQLNSVGKPIWSEALSRLHYHTVLCLTEGARAGLWPNPK